MLGSPLAILAALLVALALAAADRDSSAPAAEPSGPTAERSEPAAKLEESLAPFLTAGRAFPETSCPPPALLACRPAARLRGELRRRPSPALDRRIAVAVRSVLRRHGFRRLDARLGKTGGRIVADGETLARWRTVRARIEVAIGGLALHG